VILGTMEKLTHT